jgi:hypothetical protein
MSKVYDGMYVVTYTKTDGTKRVQKWKTEQSAYTSAVRHSMRDVVRRVTVTCEFSGTKLYDLERVYDND